MDLELLKRFYIVANAGTLEKAAEKLNVAQSAIGRSIAMFEDQLKTKLFERLPKGMQLTPQGERLFTFARQILETVDSFEKDFHESDDEISGDLKIVTMPFGGSEWLVPNLEEFLKKYPEIRPKVLLKNESINPIDGDVLICPLLPHQPHLIQKYLYTSNIRLFASQKYLDEFGIPKTIDDLNNHKLITYRGNYYTTYGSTNWLLNIGIRPGKSSRESYFEIDSLNGMLNSAIQGYGIVELPNLSIPTIEKLVEVLPELPGPKVEMYYIYSEKRKKSKKIKLLFEYLANKTTQWKDRKHYILTTTLE
jgi:DNA-binding transcriptional LysR family regulator